MVTKTIVRQDVYYDSVKLMNISSKVLELDGVEEVMVSMGTDMNKELLENIGLKNKEAEKAKSSDLIIAIKASSEESYESAFEHVDELLNAKNTGDGLINKKNPKSIDDAVNLLEDANMVIISVPGEFAAREAEKALDKNLHVLIFSDNVSLEDEVRLKKKARKKGLLLMGTECGTASVNGVGLCFANKVRKGNIGLISASGTGLQEVMVQIDKFGGGVSQGIGIGGRDLNEEIGGIMMLECLKVLEDDKASEVIVLISKPPAKSIENKIIKFIKEMKTPVVVCFLEGNNEQVEKIGATFGYNLYDTAIKAVRLANKDIKIDVEEKVAALNKQIKEGKEKLTQDQKYVRGLYGGGTLCAESLATLREKLGSIKSNASKYDDEKLTNTNNYKGNVLLDLGEEEFTKGRSHPMIDPTIRLKRIEKEAEDKTVGVILLDFVLGYGAHEDPVGATLPAIEKAKKIAKDNNREIVFVAYICGTNKDKQDYDKQSKMLIDAGVIITHSNFEAANTVAEILG